MEYAICGVFIFVLCIVILTLVDAKLDTKIINKTSHQLEAENRLYYTMC